MNEDKWFLGSAMVAQTITPVQMYGYIWVLTFMSSMLCFLFCECCSKYKPYCCENRTIQNGGIK